MEASPGSAAEIERWFVQRGLPHFIAGYSAREDVLTRSTPFLAFVFLVEIVNAPKREFAWWLNLLAVLAGIAVLVGAWAVANRARGRPLLARPRTIGPVELGLFLLVPPILPLIFGAQLRDALATFGFNAVVLVLAYWVTSYGLVPMTRWGIGETMSELSTLTRFVVRVLPLLVLFITFTFLQNELWQITAGVHAGVYGGLLVAFVITATAVSLVGLPAEVRSLSRGESWETTSERVAGTPAEPLLAAAEPRVDGVLEAPPLTRRQWVNLGLVALFSETLQVVFVSIVVFGFLVGFGFLVATPSVVAGFVEAEPNVLASLSLGDQALGLTEELLRVAGFLAVFSGFYFAVSVQNEPAYRREFLGEVLDELRRALAVRAVYLAAGPAAVD